MVALTLGADAALDRVVCIEEAAGAVHIGETRATLGERAQLQLFALLLGGRTVRHEIAVAMAGEGARCRLDGGFVVGGRDEANIVAVVDHQAPGGETRELVKGVAAGNGHGAFQGKIIVREGAQRTDAQQTSRNLIIGRRAVIDTKPELEILADDVKCAHGALVSGTRMRVALQDGAVHKSPRISLICIAYQVLFRGRGLAAELPLHPRGESCSSATSES